MIFIRCLFYRTSIVLLIFFMSGLINSSFRVWTPRRSFPSLSSEFPASNLSKNYLVQGLSVILSYICKPGVYPVKCLSVESRLFLCNVCFRVYRVQRQSPTQVIFLVISAIYIIVHSALLQSLLIYFGEETLSSTYQLFLLISPSSLAIVCDGHGTYIRW